MRVNAPLDRSTRSVAADWVELHALFDESVANEQSLIRSQAVQREPDHGSLLTDLDAEVVDEEILEPENDELSERVYEELAYRERVLGALYPFKLVSEYGKWSLRRRAGISESDGAAHRCYISCLLISSIHSELLPTKSDHDVFKSSARALQVEAYLTAAEVLGGRAFWFGSPRPDGSGMLKAIQDLASSMGTAVAPEARPLGLSANAADGTVDIVAWRPFLDGQAASIVAYGQVASGRNWTAKPIKSFIDGHFLPWFAKAPSHKHIEMLFVPFPQHHEQQEEKGKDFRVVASEKARLRENDYGVVIDRLRLTELMARSKVGGLYDKPEYEQHEEYVETWTTGALAYAEGADAVA
ncbi:hypothetical protein SAMN02745244_02606 [Tessaracoccus bendigoensis DSM 12906]|uniref:Uncharacterized protein n=1 Tax=Tessaracoccus bendigoensis DSM 12906 TaxID=1123357 RepID=A0A1M6JNQ3_9ACTN|nr:hypothetical protein [Tessaracoccus bendigoensis]SHJ48331.1 hypothetical protein SAMN02745244_02606 [Tessaracoccus bendigoensis DSM 12906]